MSKEIVHFPKIRKKLTKQQKKEAAKRLRKHRKDNPKKWKEYRKRHYEHNKSAILQKQRVTRLKQLFGLSTEQYDTMFQSQAGLCAICNLPETFIGRGGKVNKLAVDHNHTTGEVRELLCTRCNTTLGLMLESPDRLRAAASYIEKHNV